MASFQPKESCEKIIHVAPTKLIGIAVAAGGKMGGAMSRPTYDDNENEDEMGPCSYDNEYEFQYWCHFCNRFVPPLFLADDHITCFHFHLGFVEKIC